jgi:hypothetical protein
MVEGPVHYYCRSSACALELQKEVDEDISKSRETKTPDDLVRSMRRFAIFLWCVWIAFSPGLYYGFIALLAVVGRIRGQPYSAEAWKAVAVLAALFFIYLGVWACLVGGLRRWSRGWRWFVLGTSWINFPILGLSLLALPGACVALYVYWFLLRRDVRAEFQRIAALRVADLRSGSGGQ